MISMFKLLSSCFVISNLLFFLYCFVVLLYCCIVVLLYCFIVVSIEVPSDSEH
jgi:hypothetical protein